MPECRTVSDGWLSWRQRLWVYPLVIVCGVGFGLLVAVIREHVSVVIH